MQTDCCAFVAGIEGRECGRFIASEMPRRNHHRCGIEASAEDQFADCGADARGNSIVVGAQPDTAGSREHDTFVYSAARDATGRALADSLARLTLCSATK